MMVSIEDTPERGPRMFNPVVVDLPLAVAVMAILAAAVGGFHVWAQRTALWDPWKPPARTPAPGRHRMTHAKAADPHRRDWAYVTAERLCADVVVIPGDADWHQPGVIEIAGHDDRPMITRQLTAGIDATRRRDGSGMWSWSDAEWADDTGEIAAAR